ncbi:hypothetical protein F1880_004781 [Penicillium rolfsii]|nr:hypothetical protein F1880_004781 [Penicillium rolfsii]
MSPHKKVTWYHEGFYSISQSRQVSLPRLGPQILIPAKLLSEILSAFPSAFLLSIMTVSKKFQAVAVDIFRLRVINIPQRLEELKLVLECGEPSEISPSIRCQYHGMRGLDLDNSLPQRLTDVYLVFKPEAQPIESSPVEPLPGEEDRTLKRRIHLSVFETFGQFTTTLKLPWTHSRFFVPPRGILCDKTVRLGRKWLEESESRIFWLDDAEHIGVCLRALQLDALELEYIPDEDADIWEVNVEEISCRAIPFLVDVERAHAMKTCQAIVHLRA